MLLIRLLHYLHFSLHPLHCSGLVQVSSHLLPLVNFTSLPLATLLPLSFFFFFFLKKKLTTEQFGLAVFPVGFFMCGFVSFFLFCFFFFLFHHHNCSLNVLDSPFSPSLFTSLVLSTRHFYYIDAVLCFSMLD